MEQTIIKPTPGRKSQIDKPSIPDADSTLHVAASDNIQAQFGAVQTFGQNALVAHAQHIFSKVIEVGAFDVFNDVASLQESFVFMLREYESNLRTEGVQSHHIDQARFLLCSAVDEAILQQEWGLHSTWSQKPLMSIFYASTSGGQDFFEIIHNYLDFDDQGLDVLEVAYVCLCLGFRGELRLQSTGEEKANQLGAKIVHHLRRRERAKVEAFSLGKERIINEERKFFNHLPLWVFLSLTLAILASLFTYLNIELNKYTNQSFTALVNLVPEEEVVSSMVIDSPAQQQMKTLEGLLAADIANGNISMSVLTNKVRITFSAGSLFHSGNSEVLPRYHETIDNVSKALSSTQGKIIVVGHTDNTPIFSSRYPSNWHLSLQRAISLTNALTKRGRLIGRIIPEGLGDARPKLPNTSEENKAINRRVEVDLIVPTAEGVGAQ